MSLAPFSIPFSSQPAVATTFFLFFSTATQTFNPPKPKLCLNVCACVCACKCMCVFFLSLAPLLVVGFPFGGKTVVSITIGAFPANKQAIAAQR
uniref:Uncharacterized protein n=1 Tax=Anopheles darlingi TaxID=43151 RepID=A0A2M4D4K0_ANODA